MVDTRKVRDEADTMDLCETFSTEDYKLLQTDTGKVYGKSVIDVIEGYYPNGKPYSRYHYEETEEIDPDAEVV